MSERLQIGNWTTMPKGEQSETITKPVEVTQEAKLPPTPPWDDDLLQWAEDAVKETERKVNRAVQSEADDDPKVMDKYDKDLHELLERYQQRANSRREQRERHEREKIAEEVYKRLRNENIPAVDPSGFILQVLEHIYHHQKRQSQELRAVQQEGLVAKTEEETGQGGEVSLTQLKTQSGFRAGRAIKFLRLSAGERTVVIYKEKNQELKDLFKGLETLEKSALSRVGTDKAYTYGQLEREVNALIENLVKARDISKSRQTSLSRRMQAYNDSQSQENDQKS